MRRMTYSDVKKFVASWPRELAGLAGLVSAVLLVLWQLGQVTLVQILTGLLVLAGLYWTSRRVLAVEETVRVAEEGQITDRFTKAIAHLGADNMAIRLGGIYALERIAKDSEKDHGPIMEVLTAYMRENAPGQMEYTPKEAEKPPTDLQAILTVLGRRETTGSDRGNTLLDLTDTQLIGADLTEADLTGADLTGADLRGADLTGADLREADLTEADLREADLTGADLREADLTEADLHEADLTEADLHETDLDEADLHEAENLTAKQVRSAKNWHKAYLPEDLQYLTE